MKYSLLFLFSLLPAFLTGGQNNLKAVSIKVDIHEGFASLDDIMTTLDGTVTFNKETKTYTYVINNQEIRLNLEHGYSQVNGENEALLLEANEESNLIAIKWVTPQLIDDEIYVPIQYIERVLGATYKNRTFTIQVKEDVVEDVEEEDIEETDIIKTEDTSITKPNQPTNKPNQTIPVQKPSGTTSIPPQLEQKPEEDISTPPQPEQKPEEDTSTPPQPEQKPEEDTSTPPQPEQKPEEDTSTPPQPEQKPEDKTEESEELAQTIHTPTSPEKEDSQSNQ